MALALLNVSIRAAPVVCGSCSACRMREFRPIKEESLRIKEVGNRFGLKVLCDYSVFKFELIELLPELTFFIGKIHEVLYIAALAEIPFPFEGIRGGQCGGDAQKHNEAPINRDLVEG